MNSSQRKSQVIIILPVIIFLVIPCLIFFEPRIDRPVIEIMEGEEVDVPEELLLSYESYTPKDTVTILNQTTLDRSRWRINHESASYVVTVPIVNISAVTIGLTVRTLDESLQFNMSEYITKMENSTSLAPHESEELKLRIPYLLMRRASRDNWFRQLSILIYFENHDFDDFEVSNFWIQAETLEDLYPVTIDIQRTNGESLYSNPTTLGLWEAPELHFNYSTLGSSTYFRPAQVNETLLLRPGYYELTLRWGGHDLTGEVRASNNSAVVNWRIKCVRIDVELAQDISGLSITIDGNFDHYYHDFLVVYSPSFYMPSGQYVSVDIQSWSNAYSGINTAVSYLDLGDNMNITVHINPGLISIGSISLTIGRILIFVISILFVLSLVLVMVHKNESIVKLLPLLILFIGIVLPWMQISHSRTHPYPTPFDVTQETWMLSPGIFTSYFSQDNFSLAIGPAGDPHTNFYGIEIGSLVLFLFLLLLVSSLHEILFSPREFTIRNDQFSVLFVLVILSEIWALTRWIGYVVWWQTFVVGPGLVVSILALVIWGILYMKVKKSLPHQAMVKLRNRFEKKKGWKECDEHTRAGLSDAAH